MPLPFRGAPPDRNDTVLRHGFAYDPDGIRADTPEASRCWPNVLDLLPLAQRQDHPTWRRITRGDLFTLCRAADSAVKAVQAYVAVGAWGTGSRVLSRRRALKPLKELSKTGELDQVGHSLVRAVELAVTQSPEAAYLALHGPRNRRTASSATTDGSGGLRVGGLGPAYGTKFLYFAAYDACVAEGQRPPLILDSNVAQAVSWLTGTQWPSGNWLPDTYAAYLDLACSWAKQWGTEPDVIERVLFAVGQSDYLAVKSLAGD